ncbi:capsular polysaccharide export protein, LipB/KpsS family [Novosphingobium soli]|uniref:Beta-3-deoxy-D-manno-oct-2-ulosonic acid transferase n=1 Tax=Novosphingobium soli TaxID=574956 RepID=A0ABV6CWV1_9SPHN
MTPVPFLRIPPFPRHRAAPLAVPVEGLSGEGGNGAGRDDGAAIAEALRSHRVGGTFWGSAVALPRGHDVLVCASPHRDRGKALAAAARSPEILARAVTLGRIRGLEDLASIPVQADPWHACAGASLVLADAESEVALVAALLGVPLRVIGAGRFAALNDASALAAVIERDLTANWRYRDPFRGGVLAPTEAIALLGHWRALVEANRPVVQVHGVARWKQVTADALLWNGTGPVPYAGRRAETPDAGAQVLAWVARSDAPSLARMEARGVRVGEIEDGMIRSTGLGANCVPPLSIVVDAAGPHFDPAQPSGLETILQTADIDAGLVRRAAALRETLVRQGISKYGRDGAHAAAPQQAGGAPADARRRVLVTGQVEDDRSVLRGGAGLANLELLRRARALEPDAWIVFKPHPDVEAGHRKGHIPDAQALELADAVDRTASIAALLDRVDAVHVLTSLAGFEALMRGREVVTHGVPFYAGWGLTRDIGPVPARRTRRRSLDELVAATLILYPRYLDPVTRLPCEAELLVERMASGEARVSTPLIRLREAQGKLNRLLGRRSRP